MRRFRHLTPTYIVDRLAVRNFQNRNTEELPLLAIGAIQFLDTYLAKTDSIFEYGSGKSTVWFAKRAGRVISVDDNAYWHDFTIRKLAEANLSNAECFLIGGGPRMPLAPVGLSYINKIKEYSNDHFDFILNDGQGRSYISPLAIDYLKPGGIFCWDDFGINSELENPHELVLAFLAKVAHWRRAFFDDGVHLTAFYFKPKN